MSLIFRSLTTTCETYFHFAAITPIESDLKLNKIRVKLAKTNAETSDVKQMVNKAVSTLYSIIPWFRLRVYVVIYFSLKFLAQC